MTRRLDATSGGIAEAARALRRGQLVAFPTETVYGLGALATDAAAIAKLYAAKGRPSSNPLIVHLAEPRQIAEIAVVDARAERLAAAFWPGPLSMVLPLRPDSGIAPAATAGLDTVAIRIPGHPIAQALLNAVADPVAAPSANRSGGVSPTTAAHVLADLDGRIELVLDAGPVAVGIESTVLDLSRPDTVRLLRPGGITREAIEAVTGPMAASRQASTEPHRSPGLLAKHYAPRTPVRLDALTVDADEALLAFGPEPLTGAVRTLNLSPKSDLAEAAHNLYAMLRALDAIGVRRIAVMPLPETGVGEALVDRLRRATAAD